MASPAPSGGGDDKPPESAPGSFTSLDPPADPERNGESSAPPSAPAQSSGDADTSAMGVAEILYPAETERGTKRPLPSRPAPCRACARRRMILRGVDPGPLRSESISILLQTSSSAAKSRDPYFGSLRSDDELSPLPSAPLPLPPPVLGMDLPDLRALGMQGLPSAVGRCGPCEFRKKILLDKLRRRSESTHAQISRAPLRNRRNSDLPAPPPGMSPLSFVPALPLDDMSLEEKLRARARRAKKRPLTVEEERGYRQCDVGKKLMRHKWDGLHHKWGMNPDSTLMAERDDLPWKVMQLMQKAQQKPSSSAAARIDVLHKKLAQMTNVLTKVLHEGGVLQVSTKLMRLLCPEVGSSAAAGGYLDGSDWGLVEKAIDNLVNQSGEDIVKTVIPKVFSKEILYDLLMVCVGRYPIWLEDNKSRLTQENYEQYQKQLDLVLNLTMVYDDDPENFSKIMKLMCKIGGCGPLPSEVINDISPGLDPSTMEQLYTGMVEEPLHNLVFGMLDLSKVSVPFNTRPL